MTSCASVNLRVPSDRHKQFLRPPQPIRQSLDESCVNFAPCQSPIIIHHAHWRWKSATSSISTTISVCELHPSLPATESPSSVYKPDCRSFSPKVLARTIGQQTTKLTVRIAVPDTPVRILNQQHSASTVNLSSRTQNLKRAPLKDEESCEASTWMREYIEAYLKQVRGFDWIHLAPERE